MCLWKNHYHLSLQRCVDPQVRSLTRRLAGETAGGNNQESWIDIGWIERLDR